MVLIVYAIIAIIAIRIIVWLIRLPIRIAEDKGITGSKLATISALSWLGLLTADLTWLVALLLTFAFEPNNLIEEQTPQETIIPIDNLETLEKLSTLRDKGIISDAEFNREKQKIMDNL
ncbi:MAG: SHOCT domain-containing protein [Alphaproteobacteria bacterium]|nr:SHOCT domain-containing protein [Alphaproteobacteria bacterium]